MTCARCGKPYRSGAERCPHCGEAAKTGGSGVFQTSTVLISSGGSDQVYRSVDEVPELLRERLIQSTNGANSATIVIADRRGRQEIGRAIRSLPGPIQRRLIEAVVGSSKGEPRFALTRVWRISLAATLILLIAALVWFVFASR